MFRKNSNENEILISLCTKISSGKKVNQNFEKLYDTTKIKMQTFVFCMLGYHSSDILQDTYQSFYMKLESGFIPDKPLIYLKSIARNLIYNEFRSKKESIDTSELDLPDITNQNSDDKELMALIKTVVSQIDQKYREVFILKEFQGLSHNEIADICDISIENSRARLTRAYKKVNTILAPYIKEIKEMS